MSYVSVEAVRAGEATPKKGRHQQRQLLMLFRTASVPVRHEGAYHQWRKDPPREKSIRLVADERHRRVTGGAGAS
jgi:hypothetical protein